MKVYVITKGVYSDTTIIGVVATQGEAETYTHALYDHEYEEFEVGILDPAMPPTGMKSYQVLMFADGTIPPPGPPEFLFAVRHNADPPDPRFHWGVWSRRMDPSPYVAEMWARDEEHAIKIANERRMVALSTPNPSGVGSTPSDAKVTKKGRKD